MLRPTLAQRSRLRRLVPAGVVGGGGIALLVATVLSNGGNFLFAVVMSRLLGADRYGALGSIIGFLTVVTVLVAAAQLAVAQTVAGPVSRRALALELRRPVVVAAAVGLGGLLLTAVLSPLLEGFLHLSTPGPVLLLGLVLFPTIAAAVPAGVLLGRQRYGFVGASLAVGALARLGIGVALVAGGLGLGGALWASVVGQALAYGVLLWPLRGELLGPTRGVPLSLQLGTAGLSLVALSGLSAFTAVDSILARHFLPRVTAGHYVAAATAARIALFAPGAVALVAFPRFAAIAAGEEGERRLLGEALVVTATLSVGAAAVLIAFPHLVVSVLFGASYAPAVPMLRVLGTAGAALGILSLLVYYHQARSSVVAACSWFGVAVAALVIIIGAHDSGAVIAWVMVASTLSVLSVALATALWRPRPQQSSLVGGGTNGIRSLLDGEASLDVTMVVPYYNPGPRFAPSIEELMVALGESGISFEVIAVSDGSTDGSEEILTGLCSNHDHRLRRVELDTNHGKGEALRVGLSQGRGRYLGFIDGDGDIPGVQVKALVDLVRTYEPDVVLGSKRHPLSEVHYPAARRIYSWGYQQLVRALFHLKVKDTQTGLKLIRREILADVLPRTLEKRFAFDLEMLVVARRLGYRRFFEAPVRIQERFSSTIRLRSVWPMLTDTLAIFYRLRILGHYNEVHKLPAREVMQTPNFDEKAVRV